MNRDDRVPRSCSPPSIFRISAASTSRLELLEPAIEFRDHVLALPRPTRRARQVVGSARAAIRRSVTSSSRRRRRCSVFCAAAWSFQKSGSAERASTCLSSSAGRAASKMPPHLGCTLREFLVAADEFVEHESQETSKMARGWRLGLRLRAEA